MPRGSLRVAPALAASCLLLAACAFTSPSEAEARLEDYPSVVRAVASREPMPDTLPIGEAPTDMRVVMAGEASAEQIRDVVDEAADLGMIEVLEVVLRDDTRTSTLVIGPGSHATDQHIADLVAAQSDALLSRYQRRLRRVTYGDEVRPVDSVSARLVSGGMDEVLSAFDRYRSVEGVGPVYVAAGRLQLRVEDDSEVTDDERQLMRGMAEAFTLRRIYVGHSIGIEIWVRPAEEAAAGQYVRTHPPYLGRVRVRSFDQP